MKDFFSFLALAVLVVASIIVLANYKGGSAAQADVSSHRQAPSWYCGYNPICKPSISQQVFMDYLAGSPASQMSGMIYKTLVNRGIDPAVAAGFFQMESQHGTQGIAAQTHSWGNIRCTEGYQCLDGFRWYADWNAAADDWAQLMVWYRDVLKKETLEEVVTTYAPPGDGNDPQNYIQTVKEVADSLRGKDTTYVK